MALEGWHDSTWKNNISINLVITGIPKQSKEDVKVIVEQVMRTLERSYKEEDTRDEYRIGREERAPIMLKLNSKELKNRMMQAVKRTR
ncbi:hypothetical protein HHI36_014969 [Cryptolaemus montrouzieri]|uniref:Uncharacterized protein n=1 Tax=Cryptolaemus montrouzieri TaxID=559131 RepID=A0ABD2N556_9CUCU